MSYETKNIRNICFMGHGNSGKTSLAESMLFTTGAIDRMGKVTDGNTVCDYDAEEIKRQITIATSVAPVNFGGCKINVLDCPGYFDFVGDVLAAIRVVETGIIFCSAKDGITVGAERSWKYLKAAGVPAMFYISKIDEEHGDFYAVLSALKEKYGAAICPVMIPLSDGTGVIDLVHSTAYQTKGGKTAKVAIPAADADKVEEMRMSEYDHGSAFPIGGLGDGSIVFIDLESGRVRGYNCDYADLEEIAENFSSLLLDLVEQALELGKLCREL